MPIKVGGKELTQVLIKTKTSSITFPTGSKSAIVPISPDASTGTAGVSFSSTTNYTCDVIAINGKILTATAQQIYKTTSNSTTYTYTASYSDGVLKLEQSVKKQVSSTATSVTLTGSLYDAILTENIEVTKVQVVKGSTTTVVYEKTGWRTVWTGSQLAGNFSWKVSTSGTKTATLANGTPTDVDWSLRTRITGTATATAGLGNSTTNEINQLELVDETSYTLAREKKTSGSTIVGDVSISIKRSASNKNAVITGSCSRLSGTDVYVASLTLTKVEQYIGGSSTTQLSAPSISNVERIGSDTLKMTLYNPNSIAVTANIKFTDAYDDVTGANTATIAAKSSQTAYVQLSSSGQYEAGWVLEVYYTASGYTQSNTTTHIGDAM